MDTNSNFWKWQMRTCTFVKFAVLLLAMQQSLLLHSTALKFKLLKFELPYKYNLRIPLIKSIRQGGVLFTPGQLTPDN